MPPPRRRRHGIAAPRSATPARRSRRERARCDDGGIRLSIRSALALAAALAVVSGIAGCSTTLPGPAASGAGTPTVQRSPIAAAPSASADSSGLARFDDAVRAALAAHPHAGGRVITTALLAAGFERAGMQVTADRTSVGLAVPSVQFAVRWHGACLIGQAGPGAREYRSERSATIDGTCLLGQTRPITW